MPATSNYTEAKARNAGGAITKKRFVKNVADTSDSVVQCDTNGELAYGVAIFSVSVAEAAKGKEVSVHTAGRAILEAGEAINPGQLVRTMADGRAGVAAGTHYVMGICDEGASGAGKECSVKLNIGGSVF